MMNTTHFFLKNEENDTKAFEDAVKAAQRTNGAKELVLQPKTYYLDATVLLQNVTDLTVRGNGATLIMTNFVQAIRLENCERVTVRDVTVDYDPLPFTQGVVVGLEEELTLVKIDDGYPINLEYLNQDTIWGSAHDPKTGGIKPGSSHTYSFRNGEEREGRVVAFPGKPHRKLEVGDQLSLFPRKDGAIHAKNCRDITLYEVNVFSAPGFGISAAGGYGNIVLKNTNIVPGPIPQGATKPRMRSVNADGSHFSDHVVGPTFDGCRVTHCGDDGINVHAFYFHILEVKDERTFIACPKYDRNDLSVGERLEFGEKDSYDYIGEAVITKFEKRYDPSYAAEKEIAWARTYHWKNEGDCIYEIELDTALPLKQFDHFTPLSRLSPGTTVKNCTFGWNRARGIVIKSPDAVIENNYVEGCSNDAVMVLPDLAWAESHFGKNLMVRGNTFVNNCLCYNAVEEGNVDCIGTVVIGVVPVFQTVGFMETYGNKNITIEDNTILGSHTYGIVVTNAEGVTIRNNTIVDPFYDGAGVAGGVYKTPADSAILIGKAKDITVTGNTVTAKHPDVTQAVSFHETCSDIRLFENNVFNTQK